jgi:opacity protein-like surface antigen
MRVMMLAVMLVTGLACSTAAYAKEGDRSVEGSLNYGTEAFDGLRGQIGGSAGFGYDLKKNLQARADLSYFRSATNQAGTNVSGTRIPLDLGVRYYYPLPDIDNNLTAYGQGALELSFDDWVPAAYRPTKTETRVGLLIGAGAEYALDPHFSALFRLQYHIVEDSYLSTGVGMAYHF